MMAALDAAKGEAVVFIDADLQDPPRLILDFINLWQQGYENVYGLRVSRNEDSYLKRTSASLFYRLFNRLSPLNMPENAGDFRLLGPKCVAALKQCKDRKPFMKALYAWTGYSSVGVEYERPARAAGTTKFNTFKLWNFALDGITANSTAPLRVWTYFGLFMALISILLSVWFVIEYFITDRNPSGFYVTTLLLISFSAINYIVLGIFGEYLGRISEEIRDRPRYLKYDED